MSHFSNQLKAFTLIFLLLLNAITSQAQNSTKETSPYSRYGLGDDISGLNVALRGMGYLSTTAAEPFSINTDNPASYPWLKLTTFEIGGEARTKTMNTSVGKYASGTSTLSYLNLGIPIGKHLGFNGGLRPVTRTFYRFADTILQQDLGQTKLSYVGQGGLNEIVLGLGGKVKNLSVGINASYQFGDFTNYNQLRTLNDTNVTVADFFRTSKVNGWRFTVGGIYKATLKKDLALRIGLSSDFAHDLKATRNEYWLSSQPQNASSTDTAFSSLNEKGIITMPMKLSGGFEFLGGNKWTAGINYSRTDWSTYTAFGKADSLTDISSRISVGVSYTPDAASIYKYFRRITYRAGFYTGTDKVRLQQTNLPYYGITAGMSLPFRRFNDRIHTSFEYGKRGTLDNGLIKENFFRFGIGFSLNDRWFVKAKYD